MRSSRRIEQYKGVIIAEGLDDPQPINEFSVFKIRISHDRMPHDEAGRTGRWHMYWVNASREEIEAIQPHIVRGWYAHFWTDRTILVVYKDWLIRDEPARPVYLAGSQFSSKGCKSLNLPS